MAVAISLQNAVMEFVHWCRCVGEYNPRPATFLVWIRHNAPHLEPQWEELWERVGSIPLRPIG